MRTIEEVYGQHAEMPFILPKYQDELLRKPIAKRQMERTEEGLLPGHIILLWRIQFGTYTTASPIHKYFYTTYGIDAPKEIQYLIDQGFIAVDSAFDSSRHLSAMVIKDLLKAKEVTGLSKMKREELDQALKSAYSEEELAACFELRGYGLLPKGRDILEAHPEIIAHHPKKSF